MGVRIVTVDTDAFVLSLLATEVLQPILGIDLNIFLVNNHSGAARKALEKKVAEDKTRSTRTSNILLGLASPDHQVFVIRNIAAAYKRLYPASNYPASNVAFALFSKENDYLLMSLKGASLESFYTV